MQVDRRINVIGPMQLNCFSLVFDYTRLTRSEICVHVELTDTRHPLTIPCDNFRLRKPRQIGIGIRLQVIFQHTWYTYSIVLLYSIVQQYSVVCIAEYDLALMLT